MKPPDRLPWAEFYRRHVAPADGWNQGEHVSLIGPTGAGKTTLALALLPRREYVVAFGTKPADSTLDRLVRRGWKRIQTWDDRPTMVPGADGRIGPQRLVLWPRFEKITDVADHPGIFYDALAAMFVERGWTVFADEVGYLTKNLGLERVAKTYWQQGRSISLSFVSATQRPAWVPLEMYSQATHLFIWRVNDARDAKRLADISGSFDVKGIQVVARNLNFHRHEVLYLNTRTGASAITIPPK